MPLVFVFPLLSAMIYVVGVLFLKRAADLGADPWRTSAVCNWVTSICFLPLIALGGTAIIPGLLWQPALVGAFFVAGQTLAFLALRIGDVSVATPVLGLKIVLVALFTTFLLADRLTGAMWAAAGLSSVAVALLNQARTASHARIGTTILLSGSAAAAFAIFDVLVQKWSPAWGSGRFLPVMMAFVSIFSLALWPLGREAGSSGTAVFRTPSFLVGAFCLALQSVIFISTVSRLGHATAANVVYSSRGLWSVLAVWLVGHWFANREQQLGRRILAWRLCGATLLLTAIVLVLVG
jgi:drug/metabolite transporter (DMT)-like permease